MKIFIPISVFAKRSEKEYNYKKRMDVLIGCWQGNKIMQKEAKARIKINELLQNAGWRFFDLPARLPVPLARQTGNAQAGDKNEKANIVLENNAKINTTLKSPP